MKCLPRYLLVPLLFFLALSGPSARAEAVDGAWAPTPPRLSFIDGEVSYWRQGAEDWVRAPTNLPLAQGDALYSGNDANFEVQFGSRSFVRADESSEVSLVAHEEHFIQFKLTAGRASFDMGSLTVGDTVEVSTPNAVFVIEHPGYYRVEVNGRDTHFITRRGGEATVITADGRSLSIYPSEEIVVTAGEPVTVATYAAPAPDEWDRWNDERSDGLGESISARYLPPEVYGAEDLDHYGDWRVVPTYGPVWIPYGMSAGWVPYSTGYWLWDPYYEWTWIDDAPWGWAPFHYGRWVYIDGFWAWAPGPVVRYPVYSPALVVFMIRDHDVSARIGLPGLWWVALSWGEPVLPWWGPHGYRGHPHWAGWGGPRIVNNVVINQTTVINVGDIHFHNASLPSTIVTQPADKFGRERVRATVENRYRANDFAPVSGELPVKPTRASLFGGAPKGVQPPRDIVSRPVVSTRTPPREPAQPWQNEPPRVRTQAVPESRYVIPPGARRAEDLRGLPRPARGTEAGPERAPPPLPPRYGDVKRSTIPTPPASGRSPPTVRDQETVRSRATPREQDTRRREAQPIRPPAAVAPPQQQAPPLPVRRPAVPAPVPGVLTPGARAGSVPPRGAVRQERQGGKERPLPGQPANQIYRGRDRER